MLTKMVKNGAPEAQCFLALKGAIASPSAIDATASRLQRRCYILFRFMADAGLFMFFSYSKKNAPRRGDFYMLSTLCALSLTLTT